MLVAFFATQDGGLASLVAGIYQGQFPGWLALVATPVLMMALSVVGIHPVITSTALLATFSGCLLYTSPSPRDATLSRMPSSA